MVYVDPGELKWKPYMLTWLNTEFSAKVKLSDATKVRDLLLLVHVNEYVILLL